MDLQSAMKQDYIKQLRALQIYKIDGVLLEKCTIDDLKQRLTQARIRHENSFYSKNGGVKDAT